VFATGWDSPSSCSGGGVSLSPYKFRGSVKTSVHLCLQKEANPKKAMRLFQKLLLEIYVKPEKDAMQVKVQGSDYCGMCRMADMVD
jgi:hypothetical protein